MSAREIFAIPALAGALLGLQLLPASAALAEDRRPDPASLSVMTINTYFMWDGVAPEDGSSQIDIPWRNSQLEAEEHMAAIAEVIARANPDIVNLVEIENEAALTALNDKFLAGQFHTRVNHQGRHQLSSQGFGWSTTNPGGGGGMQSSVSRAWRSPGAGRRP